MSTTTITPAPGSPTRLPAADSLPGPAQAVDGGTGDLIRVLSEVKGQAQFLLYLADQIEDSLQQLGGEGDPGHTAFLCRVLGMYGNQLETKYHSLGDKITEACQDVYLTVRELDLT
jgi:hypothetical protein